jgi:hypothetical protein
MKYSKSAKAWANLVYQHRPVVVEFSRVPEGCARTGCGGYHDTFVVVVHSDGSVTYEPTRGYHATVVGASPRQAGMGVEALASLAYSLLKWARRVEPWATYPKAGYNSEGELIWF